LTINCDQDTSPPQKHQQPLVCVAYHCEPVLNANKPSSFLAGLGKYPYFGFCADSNKHTRNGEIFLTHCFIVFNTKHLSHPRLSPKHRHQAQNTTSIFTCHFRFFINFIRRIFSERNLSTTVNNGNCFCDI